MSVITSKYSIYISRIPLPPFYNFAKGQPWLPVEGIVKLKASE